MHPEGEAWRGRKGGGRAMLTPEEGEILKYRLTGSIFEVKKITNQFVILHSLDGLTQIMTGKKSLLNLFEKIPYMKPRATALAESAVP